MPVDLPAVLRAHALERPRVIAVECGGKSLDYLTLDDRSDRFARALLAMGVHSGDRIAFLAKSCVEYFEYLVGAMKVGAVPVPINWRLALPEIAAVVIDSQAVVLVVDEHYIDTIEPIAHTLPLVRRIVPLAEHHELTKWSSWLDEYAVGERMTGRLDDEAIVLQIYTSGTTGHPKGVMTSSASFMSYLESLAEVARFSPDSVSLSTMPLFHIGGTGWAVAGLYRGATTHLLRDVDPDLILDTVDRRRVTNLIAVPSVVLMLLNSPRLQSTDFTSLNYLYYGGGPMTQTILQRALDAFDCAFIQGFGMTECPLVTTLAPIDHSTDVTLLRSCGRPIAGTEVRLVDPETLRDVELGAVGEMWVRSPQTFAGYWKQPDVTARTLVGGDWLRTGDAASMNEQGFLFLQDRVKDMIVSGGENVYPAEVENALVSHPFVRECAVIGVPSERWIETVKAIVIAEPGTSPTEAELISYCKSLLAGYKCPTSIDFVEELPRTPSGKVVKFQLREFYRRAPLDQQHAEA
ncbi:MAG: acyl-CoA synthetase (AMP-forming)/AMP-acid ligase [Subtercola sp.]|nr:acyl-CoA synthetase (AMP-forming)/AMP-acid ligase [Subtercola sp.]